MPERLWRNAGRPRRWYSIISIVSYLKRLNNIWHDGKAIKKVVE